MSIADINKNTVLNVKAIQFGSEGTALSGYIDTGLLGTFSGPWGATTVPCGGLLRFISGVVFFSLNGISATSDATSGVMTYSTKLSPPPYNTVNIPIFIVDQAVTQFGNCKIATDGTVTIYRTYSNSFTPNAVCGFQTFSGFYSTYSST